MTLPDQRGVALPVAMAVLAVILVLSLAFLALSKSEPVIAANQQLSSQARALAESGVERAIWALTNSGVTGGLSAPSAGATAGSPYNGDTLITAGSGGFLLTVTGVSASEVSIQSVGWAPTNDSSDPRTKAHRKVTATLTKFPTPGNFPCVVCINGSSEVEGTASVDARTDTTCGSKKGIGVYGTGASLSFDDSGSVYGADGNNTANQSTDYVAGSQTDFNGFDPATAQINSLKAYARSQGTYYQGSRTYNSSNKLPSGGVIFVDTVSGDNPTASTASSDLASVEIHGGAAPTGGFNGWIIVNGNVQSSGNYGDLKGFIYAAGTLNAKGSGSSYFEGVMVSKRVLGGSSEIGGNADLRMNCTAANGNGNIPTGWQLSAGSYREVAD